MDIRIYQSNIQDLNAGNFGIAEPYPGFFEEYSFEENPTDSHQLETRLQQSYQAYVPEVKSLGTIIPTLPLVRGRRTLIAEIPGEHPVYGGAYAFPPRYEVPNPTPFTFQSMRRAVYGGQILHTATPRPAREIRESIDQMREGIDAIEGIHWYGWMSTVETSEGIQFLEHKDKDHDTTRYINRFSRFIQERIQFHYSRISHEKFEDFCSRLDERYKDAVDVALAFASSDTSQFAAKFGEFVQKYGHSLNSDTFELQDDTLSDIVNIGVNALDAARQVAGITKADEALHNDVLEFCGLNEIKIPVQMFGKEYRSALIKDHLNVILSRA